MFFTSLISVADLAAKLDNPEWVVCDCRHDLVDTDSGRRAYAGSHLPGARFVHLDEDLSGPNGGWNAWLSARHSITNRIPAIEAARFTARARTDLARDADSLGKRGPLLLDARAPNRYRGESETLDPVAGHIPGAFNRFFQLNVEEPNGRFKPATILRREFDELLGNNAPGNVVHYCGSGVTACHNLLTMEIAGLPGSRLYPGSWSEWVADPGRPVER